MKTKNNYVTLSAVITMSISIVRARNELCTNQTIFCYEEGYKPLNIYSSTQTLDFEFCLKKCVRDAMCKVVAYSELVTISDFIFSVAF